MKRRTVITTETREIWVISRPSGETQEPDVDANEADSSVKSLISLLDQSAETDPPLEGQN